MHWSKLIIFWLILSLPKEVVGADNLPVEAANQSEKLSPQDNLKIQNETPKPISTQPPESTKESRETSQSKSPKKVTKKTLTELQKTIQKTEAIFKQEQADGQAREQNFQAQLESVKVASEITIPMMDEADEEETAANTLLEELRVQRQTIEQELESQRQLFKEQETKLVEMEIAKAASAKIASLASEIAWQSKFIELQAKYLEISKQRLELANKRLKLATTWNEKLKSIYWLSPIEERQKVVQEAAEVLKRHETTVVSTQKELPNKIARLETMATEEITEALKKATLDKDAANVEVENLRLERQNAGANLERQRKSLNDQIEALEFLKKNAPPQEETKIRNQQIAESERKVELQKNLIDLDGRHVEILKQRMELARQSLTLATTWQTALRNVDEARKQQDLEGLIQSRIAPYLSQAANLRKELQQEQEVAQRSLLEAKIQEAEGQAQQVVYELKLKHLQDQLNQLKKTALEPVNKVPPEKFTQIPNLIREFNELQKLLKDKIEVLKQQLEVIKKRGEVLEGNEFIAQAETVLTKLIVLLEQDVVARGELALGDLEKTYTDFQRRVLLRRREFPTELTEWQNLWKDLGKMPAQLMQQLQFIELDLKRSADKLSWQRWLIFIWLSLLWGGAWLLELRVRLEQLHGQLQKVEMSSFFAKIAGLGIRLLQMNIWLIALLGSLWLWVWLAQPTRTSQLLVAFLVVAWLTSKLLINWAWLWLSDKEVKTQNRSKVYQQVRWTIMVMGILTVITVLGHLEYEKYELNTPLAIRDLIDRVFMLCLSVMMFPMMRIRHLVLAFLANSIKGYWLLVISLISLLLPLSIVAVAILGMIGYINLGWKVAEHASIFLLTLTLWLIFQGILDDGVNFLKNFALRRSQYGLLWTQDIIPLGHKLLGISLIGLAVVAFLWLNGWYTRTVVHDVAVKEGVEQFFAYSLFKLGDNDINLSDLLLAILAFWAVFWFGGWCRRVTYRWIYSGVTDLGIRNSLSVFTQYAVVLIGLLVTLRAIGIDLTALTVFAGALGVGIGFGLQNIANNFISGILLLIERPLRTGDVVNIGGLYEGMVTEMGIRSLTIKTWDHAEVIVPNAELISRPFTNSTHTDTIQRAILHIKVSFESDPHQVKEVLRTALQNVSAIVKTPPYQVNLWDLADSAIDFRVEYFISLETSEGSNIKDQILFRIWDHLKQAGIQIC